MSQQIEKKNVIEAIRNRQFLDKPPSEKELKKQRYFDALTKNPPARLDEIAKFVMPNRKPDDSTAGILAQYRKMEKAGLVKILWLKEDPSKLPYIVTTEWLAKTVEELPSTHAQP